MPRSHLPPPRLSPDSLDPVHPGDVLLEEFLRPESTSLYALAKALRVPIGRVSAVVHGQRDVSADTATRLARYFGTSIEFWLSLQARYEAELARRVLLPGVELEVTPRTVAA